ncbi:MAG: alanine--tRNA ligase [Chloroflexi bacterium]|nr:alanine--tRNA ligase [Chloroflexota bacterium]
MSIDLLGAISLHSDEIRELYLKYFEENGHKIFPSSSLVPHGDPTLLLTAAGMVQFKPYFTGEAVPPAKRLTTCQKCFRTTDIESVGDVSHLTFFEMLGNFSIGDYFKKGAIEFAWEFVTKRLNIPEEKLWITIFLDDDEAFGHWREIGVPAERIVRHGEKDNYWGPAGDSGPCGPCSEIYYDYGMDIGCGEPDCKAGCDCDRFLEIWNLVFMQYNQDVNGNRIPLPKPNIDTGMGLERMAAVMQDKLTCYDTDVFTTIIAKVAEMAGRKYGQDEKTDRAIRVVVEHARSISFLIGDGVMPGNDGRGYVLRRVLRRAAMFGKSLGIDSPFISEVSGYAIDKMAAAYPDLAERRAFILNMIDSEEEKFSQTLSTGLNQLDGIIEQALVNLGETTKGMSGPISELGEAICQKLNPTSALISQLHNCMSELNSEQRESIHQALMIQGKEVFKLYDTFGFPRELTAEVAADAGLSVDIGGFEKEMDKQRTRARASQKSKEIVASDVDYMSIAQTQFVGYDTYSSDSHILSISTDGNVQKSATKGEQVAIILDSTPFYAEKGGQVADIGIIAGKEGKIVVEDVQWGKSAHVIHLGKVIEGSVSMGEPVTAQVHEQRRLDIERNHTATHLLHSALRQVLGKHVHQTGSMVAPARLRFDFSHNLALTHDELIAVQRYVNEQIRFDLDVHVYDDMPIARAKAEGAIALFGEKYGDSVRMLKVGDPAISIELCGGTHLDRTGQIGLCLIISESSVGAGMRRIEAVTGRGAEILVERRFAALDGVTQTLGSSIEDAGDKLTAVLDETSALKKRLVQHEREQNRKGLADLIDNIVSVDGVSVLAAKVEASNVDGMRQIGDMLKARMGSGVIVLGAILADKPFFIAMVTPNLIEKGIHAGNIVKKVAAATGGGGGGRPDMGQAGGKDKSKLDEALALVAGLVKKG